MTLPDRLSAALSSHRPRIGDPENRPTGREIVQRGDIRKVGQYSHPNDAVRLALVLTVDPGEESAEIVLVHPYVELATETDLVFTPDETRAPYPVAVQTRVRSAVWTLQMRERVGSLSEEDLEEFSRVTVADDPFAASPRTGPPLAGPADSRWNFKQQEVKALNQLAADRISYVFSDSLHSRWPSLPTTLKNSDASSLVNELEHLSESELTMDYLEKLSEIGAFDQDTWAGQSGEYLGQFGWDLSRDFCNSSKTLIDRILSYEA